MIESHVEIANEVYGNMNSPKPGSAGSDSGKLERPKLNLKPRSQPLEQLEGNAKRDRSEYVFDFHPWF